MKVNDLNNYTYDFFEDTCKLLKNSGFYPKRILDIGASVCQTADVFRQYWPASDILLIEGNSDCEVVYKDNRVKHIFKSFGFPSSS